MCARVNVPSRKKERVELSHGTNTEAPVNITSTITNNSSTGRTKHSRSTICLGQVRGRAPASAAIRFELVVHVQAPDRELVRVG